MSKHFSGPHFYHWKLPSRQWVDYDKQMVMQIIQQGNKTDSDSERSTVMSSLWQVLIPSGRQLKHLL